MAKATKAKTKSTTKRVTKKPTTAAKRVTTKKARRPAHEQQFMDTRLTQQTLYWFIFGVACIAFTLWLFTLDAKVRDLYDQIDENTYNSDPSLYMKADKDAGASADKAERKE